MNEKEVLTEFEENRRQSSLLSTFEEIAQTFLSSVSGKRGNGKLFTSLQDYLDGSVLTNGAYCRRRTVLLAIHDLKDELEAPSALQSKTLAKLELLHIRPVPRVKFYQDIATAILRMEVVIRLEAMQALAEPALGTAGQLAPAVGQTRKPRPWARGAKTLLRRADGSMSKLGKIGHGLAAIAFCAGAVTFLNSEHVGKLHTGAPAQLAANNLETPADTKRRARDCVPFSNDGLARQIDGNACTLGASPAYSQKKLPAVGNSFNAAELVIHSALTEAGLDSVAAPSPLDASPVLPNHSPWATSVEANNSARTAEVKTQ